MRGGGKIGEWINYLLPYIQYLFLTLFFLLVSYIVFIYYWNQDTKGEKLYENCYEITSTSDEFPKLSSPLPEHVIITSSQSNASKVRSMVKSSIIKAKRKKLKIIVLKEGESTVKREIEIIRENVSLIPGDILLNADFLYCLRNYLAYKCAMIKKPCITEVIEYFKNEFEKNSTWSVKIYELDKAEHYVDTVIFKNPKNKLKRKSILNEIFLPIVSCIYKYQIETLDIPAKPFEIKNKQSTIMEMLHGLYLGKIFIGYIVKNEINTYKNPLINDVKFQNRWGYLLLTDNEHINEFQAIGFSLCSILDNYWGKENYDCLFPIGNDLTNISYVNGVFIYNIKKKEAFRKKQKQSRIKMEPKFRKKEGY